MTQPANPMAEAQSWLRERDVPFLPRTKYQLKIGKRVSYYPSKGTTFVDGDDGARTRTGLRGLEEVLIELKYLAPEYATPVLAPTTPTTRR